MLRALKQLLKPGGRIGYYTIFVTPGLSAAERLRARRSGPRSVASRATQPALLASAGFESIEETDVTDDFRTSSAGWSAEATKHTEALRDCLPPGLFDQRQRERRVQLNAIDDGLLRRALFTARRPR